MIDEPFSMSNGGEETIKATYQRAKVNADKNEKFLQWRKRFIVQAVVVGFAGLYALTGVFFGTYLHNQAANHRQTVEQINKGNITNANTKKIANFVAQLQDPNSAFSKAETQGTQQLLQQIELCIQHPATECGSNP